jgi:NLR family CARD domain-containing protein 3
LCGLDGVSEQVYDLAGISALFRALHVNTRLKTLKIAENDIGNDGAKHLADALRENKCLSILDIHGNDLFGVLEEEILEDGAPNVTQSDQFNGEKIGAAHGANGVLPTRENPDENGESLDHSQGDLTNQHVELKYELSGLEGGGSLLTAIGESKYLSSVDISWNEMGPKGAILFAASLLNNSTLTYLDVHGNYIGDDGVSALCLYLKGDSCKLSVLYMQQVGMTPCGALLVAEVLSINKT